MAGRHRTPTSSPGHGRRDYQHRYPLDDPRPLPPQGRFPPPEVHLMQERIAAQSHEIQTLVMDNQRLAATHVALKQDVTAIQQDIRHLSATAAAVKSEKDAQVREVYERFLKLEGEARPVEGLAAELERVRAEIKERVAERKELSEKLTEIDGEVAKTKSELQHLPQLKADIEKLRMEIQRGRYAIEYEKKMQCHNAKVSEVMEKHLNSMNLEAETLRSELANEEKRATKATAAVSAANQGPGYAVHQTSLEPANGGNLLADPYAVYQGAIDASLNYALGEGSLTQAPSIPYDIQGQQQIES